jgi:hypothetical protein
MSEHDPDVNNPPEERISRRRMLGLLGLAATAVYMTPTLVSLDEAQAGSWGSGGYGRRHRRRLHRRRRRYYRRQHARAIRRAHRRHRRYLYRHHYRPYYYDPYYHPYHYGNGVYLEFRF